MPGLRHGPKIYSLGRNKTQRWHLLRTMATQLIEHERIRTTYTKAKALRPMVEKIIALSKIKTIPAERRIRGILTTQETRDKVANTISSRFVDKNGNFTRIVRLDNRKGDNAPMVYIEILGNEIEKYESAQLKQKLEQGLIPNKKSWELKTFQQERNFLLQKLEECEEQLKLKQIEFENQIQQGLMTVDQSSLQIKSLQARQKFFEQKIRRVEHDLYILNKSPMELIKYPVGFT